MPNDRPGIPGLAYFQAASLALLIVITGFSIFGLWSLVGVAAPALTISTYEWRGLHTRNAFLQEQYVRRGGAYYPKSPADAAAITLDDATERWRDARSDALAVERSRNVRHVVLWLVALVVCMPLYLLHRRVIERAMNPTLAGDA